MYAACFEGEGQSVAVAALVAPSQSSVLVPKPWQGMLLAARQAGFALRLTQRQGRREALILLRATSSAQVTELAARMIAAIPPAEGARAAANAAEFDSLAGSGAEGPAWLNRHLWLNHRGYSVGGRPVASDFRLYPLVEYLATLPAVRSSELVYQCNFDPLTPDRERERTVRKLIASLKLDSPYPQGIAALQQAIAARLLAPGYVCDEFLATPDDDALAAVREGVEGHFHETMGKLGFGDSPLEPGQFAELLVTGLGSAALLGPWQPIAQAAAAFSVEDARQMLDLHLPPPLATGPAPPLSGKGPAVFVSYSSADFSRAWTTCQHLEANGISCWIAPRNILPGEPYPHAIMRGLEATRALVVVFSASANVSVHVLREIEAALRHRALIIPMRIEPIEPTGGMYYLLGTCQRVDAFTEFETALAQLLNRLRAELSHP